MTMFQSCFNILFVCVSVYAVCTMFPGGQKKSLDPLEVELQAAVCERLIVDAGK